MSQNNRLLIIAIDGPSASGKGTVAKKIAAHFNLPYLNTGALYRLVAFRTIQQKISLEIFSTTTSEQDLILKNTLDSLAQNIAENELENEELFGEDVGAVASIIAKNPLLRKKLFTFQQEFIANGKKQKGGAVLDGRDTTTVICPDANYKFFITAQVEIRAKRRFDQLKKQGKNITYEEILVQLKQRDENDFNRKDSPLKVAADAIVIDNGNLSIEDGFKKCLGFIS
ncbi:MAG: (d)CMP kinase [Rickettsiales bacterium]|nr:(d)CMP kinase [Rickettsiales bacterium]